MVNLPILHDLLKRGTGIKEELLMIKSGYYSGMSYVFLIKKQDEKDMEFIDDIRTISNSLMKNGYHMNDIIDIMEAKGIYLEDNYVVEKSIFMLFIKKELQ